MHVQPITKAPMTLFEQFRISTRRGLTLLQAHVALQTRASMFGLEAYIVIHANVNNT
jgi:hypothetical protein